MATFLIVGAVGLVLVLVALAVGDLLDGLLHLDALGGDLFSVSSVAAFLGAFGFGGALGLALFHHTLPAVAVGIVIGSLATWLAVKLTKTLKSDDSAASFNSSTMIGHAGSVITDIPEDGYGEVRLNVAGHVRKLNARSAAAIPSGSEVWVSAILSPTAVEVVPVSPRELNP